MCFEKRFFFGNMLREIGLKREIWGSGGVDLDCRGLWSGGGEGREGEVGLRGEEKKDGGGMCELQRSESGVGSGQEGRGWFGGGYGV